MVAAPPPVPLAIAFRDPAHGILGTSRTIELTGDGGKTWQVVLRTPRPVSSVWVAGSDDWARYDDGENLRSRDGGRTWRPAVASVVAASACPQGTEQSFVSLEWALCVTEAGAGSEGKSVYHLGPRGWKRVAYTPFAPVRPGAHGGISLYGYPVGIAMAPDAFGVIWESRGTLYVTRDGGSHWTGLPKVARPEVDFGQSGAALPHGVAYVLLSVAGSGRRRLIGTRDAGRTWRVVHRWP